jgi:hypothetical protein
MTFSKKNLDDFERNSTIEENFDFDSSDSSDDLSDIDDSFDEDF